MSTEIMHFMFEQFTFHCLENSTFVFGSYISDIKYCVASGTYVRVYTYTHIIYFVYTYTVDVVRFAGLNIYGFSPI